LPLLRNFHVLKGSLYGTLWHASSAVNALVRMDVVLVLSFVDAVYGTDFYTSSIFDINAWFTDNIGHVLLTSS